MRMALPAFSGEWVTEVWGIWASIHGDQQMADFQRFRKLLAA